MHGLRSRFAVVPHSSASWLSTRAVGTSAASIKPEQRIHSWPRSRLVREIEQSMPAGVRAKPRALGRGAVRYKTRIGAARCAYRRPAYLGVKFVKRIHWCAQWYCLGLVRVLAPMWSGSFRGARRAYWPAPTGVRDLCLVRAFAKNHIMGFDIAGSSQQAPTRGQGLAAKISHSPSRHGDRTDRWRHGHRGLQGRHWERARR